MRLFVLMKYYFFFKWSKYIYFNFLTILTKGDVTQRMRSGLGGSDGKNTLGVRGPHSCNLSGPHSLLPRGQGTPLSHGKLGTEVKGLVLFALPQFTQVGLLLLVHDSEGPGDILPDNLDLVKLAGSTAGHLGDTELGQLHLELFKNLLEFLLSLGPQLGTFQLTHFASLVEGNQAILACRFRNTIY